MKLTGASLLVVALAACNHGAARDSGAQGPTPETAQPSASAGNTANTSAVFHTAGGFRYSIVTTPPTSAVQIGNDSARPGYHYLVAKVTVTNLEHRDEPNPMNNQHVSFFAPQGDVNAAGDQNGDCEHELNGEGNGVVYPGLYRELAGLCSAYSYNNGRVDSVDLELDSPIAADSSVSAAIVGSIIRDGVPTKSVSAWVWDFPPGDQAGHFTKIPVVAGH